MLRRWCIVLAMAGLTLGIALTASSASAAPSYGALVTPGGPVHLVSSGAGHGHGLRFQAQSTNWSGYAGTAGPYASASASWTQPAGTCSQGDQYAAFWVGIDGYRSGTVEQTGTEVDCIGRTARYYAWYEMYPGPSETYSSPVQPGDQLTATVTWLGGEEFSLAIQDVTQGWSQTADASLSQTPSRSSAEAIVEAPCCTASGGILPLADFGTVNFSSSSANGAALGNAGGLTQITMADKAGRDKDSISSLGTAGTFSATWLRSN